MLSEGSSVKESPEDKQTSGLCIKGSAKISRRVTLALYTGPHKQSQIHWSPASIDLLLLKRQHLPVENRNQIHFRFYYSMQPDYMCITHKFLEFLVSKAACLYA